MDIDPRHVDETLATTRAVRRRLDLERPVDNQLLLDCIELAEQAPTGGNLGSRRWIIVRDQAVKEQLGQLYKDQILGFMPVFLRVCDANARTESIIAPSITWNDVIHWTGTFRWFHYPADDQTLTLIASASTRINSGVLLQWRDLPRRPPAH